MGDRFCSVKNCFNSRLRNKDLRFYRFPKDEKRCEVWLHNSERIDLSVKQAQSHVVCGRHFTKDQFMNHRRLYSHAVPTLILGGENARNLQHKHNFEDESPDEEASPHEHAYESPNEEASPHERAYESPDEEASREQPSPKRPRLEPAIVATEIHEQHQKTDDILSIPCTRARYTPRKLKQRKKLHVYRSRTLHLSRKMQEIETKLTSLSSEANFSKIKESLSGQITPSARVFITSQLGLAMKKKNCKWLTQKEKNLAFLMYFKSPQAYRKLRSILKLPTKATLQRWLQESEVKPGFSPVVFQALMIKVEHLSELERHCSISFDEMSLREELHFNNSSNSVEGYVTCELEESEEKQVANHAIVFMVCGLFRKWKQPLYFFVKDASKQVLLAALLHEVVKRVEETGLIVKTIVCDQNSNNCSLFAKLDVTSEQPYTTFLSSRKVFCFFDPPHILKCVRDNLKKHNLTIDGKVCKWAYLKEFFVKDSQKPFRLAPELTTRHVYLPNLSNVCVKLAAQVFSRTVGVGISTLAAYNILPSEATHLAELLIKLDKWFDTFNSVQMRDSKMYKRAISKNSKHIAFLKRFLKELDLWSFNTINHIPTLKGLKLTTNALILLWKDLQKKVKPKFLTTRQLNRDCVENSFLFARSKGGFRERPTPSEVHHAYKNIVVNNLLKPFGNRKDCQTDIEDLLLDLTNFHLDSTARSRSTTVSSTTSVS